jgi:hypothetical protein
MTANKNAITTRAIVVVSKSNALEALLTGVRVDVGA